MDVLAEVVEFPFQDLALIKGGQFPGLINLLDGN